MNKKLADHAAATAHELGTAVFPVRVEPDPERPGKTSKHPLVSNWTNGAAKIDPDEVRALFAAHPEATHAGLRTGGESRLLVVDLDGPDAQRWAAERPEMLPATRTQPTQRAGGSHLYYSLPAGVELRNSAGKLAPGIDTRASGGFVVDWSIDAPPSGDPIVEAPVALIEELANPTAGGASAHGAGDGAGKIREGQRNVILTHLAGKMRHAGFGEQAIAAALLTHNGAACDPPLAEAEVLKVARSIGRYEPGVPDTRPVLQITGGALHVVADAAERLVAGDVYMQGTKLVRLGVPAELPAAEGERITRDAAQPVIVGVSGEYLRREITRRASVLRFSRQRNQYEPVDCPRELAENILHAGSSPHFRPLNGIATAPFLRADLSICARPGYDAASGVILEPTINCPVIPDRPSRDVALAALRALAAPFEEFPYATPAARVAALAHVLTAVARHAIGTSPVFTYTATLAGTGKTLLSRMPALIVSGTPPGLRPFPAQEDELRKTLLAALLAGDTALLFDNISNGTPVRSPALCAFATADVYQDRKLGVSESPRIPNRTTVAMTGNNISPAGDLVRRSIVVRLDVNAESPKGRVFEINDLDAYVREHRPELLVAALTVIRAYAVSGVDMLALPPLPSFERWSRVVRDPLVWLGCEDPVSTQETEADDEVSPLRAAFTEIANNPHLKAMSSFKARDIVNAAEWADSRALREALEACGCRLPLEPGEAGNWLRANRGRVAGGFKLVRLGGSHGNVSAWRLEMVQK